MKICILETGIAPAPLDEQYGRYPQMFAQSLNADKEQFAFETIAVSEGASLPSVDHADGFLITGSPAGVYEDHAWISPLEAFIVSIAQARKPLIGICFGHQIMSQAFGGKVAKSEKGWGVGVHTYAVADRAPFMSEAPFVSCAVSHQDQVITPPPGATVHGGSDFCPNGILSYAQGPAFSLQMHPEFEHAFGADLLKARADRIPAKISKPALESYTKPSSRDILLEWMITFFKQAGTHG